MKYSSCQENQNSAVLQTQLTAYWELIHLGMTHKNQGQTSIYKNSWPPTIELLKERYLDICGPGSGEDECEPDKVIE